MIPTKTILRRAPLKAAAVAGLVSFFGTVLIAQDMAPREGWVVLPTAKTYDDLVRDVKSEVTARGLIVVTEAGPTKAAARRGISIPGNRVIGVFNNDFAVRMLSTSTAAMIEAPVRFYVTENADGTATLSFKRPVSLFAPYADEGGADLVAIAEELEAVFTEISQAAISR